MPTSASVSGTAFVPHLNGAGHPAATGRSGNTLSGLLLPSGSVPGAGHAAGIVSSLSPATAGSAICWVKPSVNRMW